MVVASQNGMVEVVIWFLFGTIENMPYSMNRMLNKFFPSSYLKILT